jgi:hypothetical protein
MVQMNDGVRSWTGNYTQCLMSQYNNAMYVLGADSSDLSVSRVVPITVVSFEPMYPLGPC